MTMYSRTLTPVSVPSRNLNGTLADRLWFWIGLVVTISCSLAILWFMSEMGFLQMLRKGWLMIAGSIVAFVATSILLDRTLKYPGRRSSLITVPIALFPVLILVAIIAFTRMYYSRSYLIVECGMTLIWAFSLYQYKRRPHARSLAVLPFGDTSILKDIPGLRLVTLKKPRFYNASFDGIVADLHAEIPGEWTKFLADSVMQQIRVYHAASIAESLKGRVSLGHLAAMHVDSLRPPPWFNPCKRSIDIAMVLITAPITIPLGLIAATLVRLDSRGPAIYRQARTGAKGREFTLLKFRSMRQDAESEGQQFATHDDPRITHVGKFLRKSRLDELPQLWNILKGDMSLVGPRPERPVFVEEYERDIEHYQLRHLVRPGLTGWAQIEIGYSSDKEGTIRKLERDFYYIKYRSLSLDIFVIYRTIRIVCSGSGAR